MVKYLYLVFIYLCVPCSAGSFSPAQRLRWFQRSVCRFPACEVVSHLFHAAKRHSALSIGRTDSYRLQRASYLFLKSYNKRIWTWRGKCLGEEWEPPSSICLVTAQGVRGTQGDQMFKIASLHYCVLRNQTTISWSSKDNWLTHNPVRLTDLLIKVSCDKDLFLEFG